MRHRYECPLRWADMDAFGHVNNVVFLRYLEEARIDLLFRMAGEASVGGFASGVVVARHEISYRRPLTYRPEPVTVEMWVTRLGAASFTVAYEVKDVAAADGAERLYAEAASVLVPYDLASGRPRRVSAEERGFVEKYLAAPEVEAAAGAA